MNYGPLCLVGFVSLGHLPSVPAALPLSIIPVIHYKVAPKPDKISGKTASNINEFWVRP